MPTFRVTFDQPVWYQPDHPTASRLTATLEVQAPDARRAETHALRVTRGDGAVIAVTDLGDEPLRAPAIEVLQAEATISYA